jgi:hypothetical protein
MLEIQFDEKLSSIGNHEELKGDLLGLTEQIINVIAKAGKSKSIINALLEATSQKKR